MSPESLSPPRSLVLCRGSLTSHSLRVLISFQSCGMCATPKYLFLFTFSSPSLFFNSTTLCHDVLLGRTDFNLQICGLGVSSLYKGLQLFVTIMKSSVPQRKKDSLLDSPLPLGAFHVPATFSPAIFSPGGLMPFSFPLSNSCTLLPLSMLHQDCFLNIFIVGYISRGSNADMMAHRHAVHLADTETI